MTSDVRLKEIDRVVGEYVETLPSGEFIKNGQILFGDIELV